MENQGSDRKLWFVQQKFFWPKVYSDVVEKVGNCSRCVWGKTPERPKTDLVTIQTSRPRGLVCIDFLSLEKSDRRVWTYLSDYGPLSKVCYGYSSNTEKQSEHFFRHCSYLVCLHLDQVRNFESSAIKELCRLAGVKKSCTTPYHPMGNGQVEGFYKTLLKLLETIDAEQKQDRKTYGLPLDLGYNETKHNTTGNLPH